LRKAKGGKQKARNPPVSPSGFPLFAFAFRWSDLKTGSQYGWELLMTADPTQYGDWQRAAALLAMHLRDKGIADERVLQRLSAVPRHEFVPAHLRSVAYQDVALPILAEQTISQPYIVALMTSAAELTPKSVVLEIGTGSGYQAAILAGLCRQLVTIERLPELAEAARERMARLGLQNIVSLVGDGTLGVFSHAPYDAILVTAGAPEVPQSLLRQLTDGGRLIIPVGSAEQQALLRYVRRGETWEVDKLCDCRFVKLWGTQGWELPTPAECTS